MTARFDGGSSRDEIAGMSEPARVWTYADGAPDLAIEVLSPHSRRVDLALKHRIYAAEGVPEY